MGKINGFLSGTRKKIDNVVFQKGSNGGTIGRAYVIPKNPRTQAQMAQRIIFATVAQAAKAMEPIINHSFEGVEYGAKSTRRFMKLNIAALREFAANDFENMPKPVDATVFTTTKGVSALVPNSYIVADGSLSKPKAIVQWNNTDEVLEAYAPAVNFPMTQGSTDAKLAVPVGNILRSWFGIASVNDQLTLSIIANTSRDYVYSYEGDNAPGFQIPTCAYSAMRLYIKADADLTTLIDLATITGTTASLDANAAQTIMSAIEAVVDLDKTDRRVLDIINGLLTDSEITLDGTAVASGYDLELSEATKSLDDPFDSDTHVYAAGFILSRLTDGKWKRSPTMLKLGLIKDGFNNGLIWAQTLDAWFSGQKLANSTRFLNKGTDAKEVGENF